MQCCFSKPFFHTKICLHCWTSVVCLCDFSSFLMKCYRESSWQKTIVGRESFLRKSFHFGLFCRLLQFFLWQIWVQRRFVLSWEMKFYANDELWTFIKLSTYDPSCSSCSWFFFIHTYLKFSLRDLTYWSNFTANFIKI